MCAGTHLLSLLPQALTSAMLPVEIENADLLAALVETRLQTRALEHENDELASALQSTCRNNHALLGQDHSMDFHDTLEASVVELRTQLWLHLAEVIALLIALRSSVSKIESSSSLDAVDVSRKTRTEELEAHAALRAEVLTTRSCAAEVWAETWKGELSEGSKNQTPIRSPQVLRMVGTRTEVPRFRCISDIRAECALLEERICEMRRDSDNERKLESEALAQLFSKRYVAHALHSITFNKELDLKERVRQLARHANESRDTGNMWSAEAKDFRATVDRLVALVVSENSCLEAAATSMALHVESAATEEEALIEAAEAETIAKENVLPLEAEEIQWARIRDDFFDLQRSCRHWNEFIGQEHESAHALELETSSAQLKLVQEEHTSRCQSEYLSRKASEAVDAWKDELHCSRQDLRKAEREAAMVEHLQAESTCLLSEASELRKMVAQGRNRSEKVEQETRAMERDNVSARRRIESLKVALRSESAALQQMRNVNSEYEAQYRSLVKSRHAWLRESSSSDIALLTKSVREERIAATEAEDFCKYIRSKLRERKATQQFLRRRQERRTSMSNRESLQSSIAFDSEGEQVEMLNKNANRLGLYESEIEAAHSASLSVARAETVRLREELEEKQRKSRDDGRSESHAKPMV